MRASAEKANKKAGRESSGAGKQNPKDSGAGGRTGRIPPGESIIVTDPDTPERPRTRVDASRGHFPGLLLWRCFGDAFCILQGRKKTVWHDEQ